MCRPITTDGHLCVYIFSAKFRVDDGSAARLGKLLQARPPYRTLSADDRGVAGPPALSDKINFGALTKKALERQIRWPRMIHLFQPHTLMGHQFFRETLDRKVRAQFLIVAPPRLRKARAALSSRVSLSFSATIIIVISSAPGTACWASLFSYHPLSGCREAPTTHHPGFAKNNALAPFVTLRAQIFD
jgi:hypothetical protein